MPTMTNSSGTDELLTVDQLAKRLQVAPITVRVWTRQGDIPATRCGRLLRYRYAEVMSAFERDQRKVDGLRGSVERRAAV